MARSTSTPWSTFTFDVSINDGDRVLQNGLCSYPALYFGDTPVRGSRQCAYSIEVLSLHEMHFSSSIDGLLQ